MQYLLEHNKNQKNENIIDSLSVFASLYIFILIFFLLLNTSDQVSVESKAKAFESIAQTFNRGGQHSNNNPLVISQVEDLTKLSIVAMVKGLFPNSAVNLPYIGSNKDYLLSMVLDYNYFFEDDSWTISSYGSDFFVKLLELLYRTDLGGALSLEIIFTQNKINNSMNKDLFVHRFAELHKKAKSLNPQIFNLKFGIGEYKDSSILFNFYFMR